jgi:hypothetical protein
MFVGGGGGPRHARSNRFHRLGQIGVAADTREHIPAIGPERVARIIGAVS